MRLFGNITITIFTFALGITLVAFWNFIFPAIPQIEVLDEEQIISCQIVPIETNACELRDFPDSFDGKWITLEATIYTVEDRVIVYPIDHCLNYHCIAHASHDNWPPARPRMDFNGFREKYPKLFKKLSNKNPHNLEVDVRIEGEARKITDKYQRKMYLIIPENMQAISKFRKFFPKGSG